MSLPTGCHEQQQQKIMEGLSIANIETLIPIDTSFSDIHNLLFCYFLLLCFSDLYALLNKHVSFDSLEGFVATTISVLILNLSLVLQSLSCSVH